MNVNQEKNSQSSSEKDNGDDEDNNNSNVRTCAICLEDENVDDDKSWYELQCHHQYHYDCIQQWLRQSLTCPQCRHPIDASQSYVGDGIITEEQLQQLRFTLDNIVSSVSCVFRGRGTQRGNAWTNLLESAATQFPSFARALASEEAQTMSAVVAAVTSMGIENPAEEPDERTS